MDKRIASAYKLSNIAQIFHTLAFLTVLLGMMFLFGSGGYYHRLAWIMPFISAVIILGMGLLMSKQISKNKLFAIAAFVGDPIVLILLFSNSVLIDWENTLHVIGYVFDSIGSLLLSVSLVLEIVFMVLMPRNGGISRKDDVEPSGYINELQELNNLLDGDIITVDEFEIFKQKVLDKYEDLLPPEDDDNDRNEVRTDTLNGEYVHNNTKIIINNETFEISVKDNVMRSGKILFSTFDTISLIDDVVNKKMTFKIDGDSLVSVNGDRYEKIW